MKNDIHDEVSLTSPLSASSFSQKSLNTPTALNSAKILLMGLRRSGKSSIQQVVFRKLNANDTLYMESTDIINKFEFNSFEEFQIWDFPGQVDLSENNENLEEIFLNCGALVYVIDAQDDYLEALHFLFSTITAAYKINPKISFEVLIHKVDGLSDDHKIETQRDIHQRMTEELEDYGLDVVRVSFYLTSIYDYSIYEAFSKIVQKLMTELPTLENLLNIFCSNSGIEKAFLFDVFSKIYIATDASPVDIQSYELCSDVIDVFLDISSIYDASEDPNDGIYGKKRHDAQSHSLIKLNNGMVLYSRAINHNISLVCLLKSDNFDRQFGIIEYNFELFKDSVLQVHEIKLKSSCK